MTDRGGGNEQRDVDGTEPKRSSARKAARNWLAAAGRACADVIVPAVCLDCQTPVAAHDTLCPDCWQRIDFIRPPLCDRLGIPMPFDAGDRMISAAAAADPPDYDRARAVARYDGAMRDLVVALKFHDQHQGRRLFGRWLSDAGRELLADADVVVPVPLSRLRLIWRRFNQSALLAQEVARLNRLPYRPLALVRTRRTRPQPGLSRRERETNVRGAFEVSPKHATDIAGRAVLLIDDVVTTGATVGACARSLKGAGARRVDVLALALVTDHAVVAR